MQDMSIGANPFNVGITTENFWNESSDTMDSLFMHSVSPSSQPVQQKQREKTTYTFQQPGTGRTLVCLKRKIESDGSNEPKRMKISNLGMALNRRQDNSYLDVVNLPETYLFLARFIRPQFEKSVVGIKVSAPFCLDKVKQTFINYINKIENRNSLISNMSNISINDLVIKGITGVIENDRELIEKIKRGAELHISAKDLKQSS